MAEFNLVKVSGGEVKVPALDKLLDYVASGIGATAGPMLAPWCASREGKAKIITAEADAKVRLTEAATDIKIQQMKQTAAENSTSQLIAKEQAQARKYVVPDELEPGGHVRIGSNDVQKAMEFQAKKRLMNVGAIAGHAAEELKDKEVPDHDPDPDWTARFFDGAQDVSSEELQKLWGKILAGEVKSPGQTSLRTLSILKNMTQKEAQDFLNLMHYRIWTFILEKEVLKVLGERSINLIAHFSDIGLLRGFGISPNLIIQDDGTLTHKHCGYILRIAGQPGQQLDTVLTPYNTALITAAGLELAQLCQHQEPDITYLSHFARLLAKQNCKLAIRKVENREGKEIQLPDIYIIKPFAEPQERNQEEPNNAK